MLPWSVALKAVLPYAAQIVTTAIPAFTSRKNQEKSAEIVVQQISELQDAAKSNAESVHVLAEQLRRTITAVEEGAVSFEQSLRQFEAHNTALERRLSDLQRGQRRGRILSLCAGGLALAAIGAVILLNAPGFR